MQRYRARVNLRQPGTVKAVTGGFGDIQSVIRLVKIGQQLEPFAPLFQSTAFDMLDKNHRIRRPCELIYPRYTRFASKTWRRKNPILHIHYHHHSLT
jgi:hypothetical protein